MERDREARSHEHFATTRDRFRYKVVMPLRGVATTSSRHNLDTINFFVAAVQTGFGPFIAVILTEHGWTQTDIGFALSVGTFTALASQLPAGALVDRFHDRRLPALLAIVAIGVCALVLAFWPAREPVLASEVVHGFASSMLGPAIAALTLATYGQERIIRA